jgi:hypothetical protein
MSELMEEYSGKYLAIVEDEIVSSGEDEFEAYKKAKAIHPDKEVSLVYVPTEEETVTLL